MSTSNEKQVGYVCSEEYVDLCCKMPRLEDRVMKHFEIFWICTYALVRNKQTFIISVDKIYTLYVLLFILK